MQKGLLFLILMLSISCKDKSVEQSKDGIDPSSDRIAQKANDSLYLFTSFREPADKGLFLAYSSDGYQWEDLKGPYLEPKVGKSGIMRDPSVVKGPDGTYHMVWTTDWRGGNGFGYASTKDFIHWTQQRFIPVMEHEPEVVNVWAPELFYDQDRDRFIIIWASTIPFRFEKGEEEEKNNHRMYFTTTSDFEEFTSTELLMDAGFSMIDCVIVKRAKDDYVLVMKDNTRPNRHLLAGFASDPLGPYTHFTKPFSGFLSEGPTVIEEDGKFIIYYDNYGEKNYAAVATEDFHEFEDISDQIKLPEGHKHGTITKISKAALQGLVTKSKMFQ
ncbi:glycoside hydrolase family 43 protein [Galbibacter sp.]|uniref:glycoside hydrolase family 43 protein n=1 Tax=Galbibacter sp. TaxID=2918471 RepID=UPI003A8E9405